MRDLKAAGWNGPAYSGCSRLLVGLLVWLLKDTASSEASVSRRVGRSGSHTRSTGADFSAAFSSAESTAGTAESRLSLSQEATSATPLRCPLRGGGDIARVDRDAALGNNVTFVDPVAAQLAPRRRAQPRRFMLHPSPATGDRMLEAHQHRRNTVQAEGTERRRNRSSRRGPGTTSCTGPPRTQTCM